MQPLHVDHVDTLCANVIREKCIFLFSRIFILNYSLYVKGRSAKKGKSMIFCQVQVLFHPLVVLFLKEKWGYFFPVKRPEGGMVRDHRAD